jgi:hypothetical protein
MSKFFSRSSKHFDPVFPPAYDLRKSELGMKRMIEREKDRLKRVRLICIVRDMVRMQKAM